MFQSLKSICTYQRSCFHVNPLHPSAEGSSGYNVDIGVHEQNTIISIPSTSFPCQNDHLLYSQWNRKLETVFTIPPNHSHLTCLEHVQVRSE